MRVRRSALSKLRRRGRVAPTTTRLGSRLETLEPRLCLSGDSFSAWQNPFEHSDVTSDGTTNLFDLLEGRRCANNGGPRPLIGTPLPNFFNTTALSVNFASSSSSSSNTSNSTDTFLDVDGDTNLTVFDLLGVVNQLNNLGLAAGELPAEGGRSVRRSDHDGPAGYLLPARGHGRRPAHAAERRRPGRCVPRRYLSYVGHQRRFERAVPPPCVQHAESGRRPEHARVDQRCRRHHADCAAAGWCGRSPVESAGLRLLRQARPTFTGQDVSDPTGLHDSYLWISQGLDVDQITYSPATVTVAGPTAVLPTISVTDVSITEGDSGTKDMVFTITVSNTGFDIEVPYATVAGGTNPATPGSDFTGASGTLTFDTGSGLTQTVTVKVSGDVASEPNETFFFNHERQERDPAKRQRRRHDSERRPGVGVDQ